MSRLTKHEALQLMEDIQLKPELYLPNITRRTLAKIKAEEAFLGVDAMTALEIYTGPDTDEEEKQKYFRMYILLRGLIKSAEF